MARDLHAGLADHALGVCSQERPDRSWVARITLRQNADATITIEVDDRWTNKRVLREISVRREADGSVVDADGLTLAVATEELLRATWAEMDLNAGHNGKAEAREPEAGKPEAPPRSSPSETEVAESRPPTLRRWEGGVGARALAALAHQATWGAFAFLGSQVGTGRVRQTLTWTLAFGGQWGRSPVTALGEVNLWALGADLLLGFPLVEASGFRLGPSLGSSLQHWTFSPKVRDGIDSSTARGWVWVALAGLSAQHRWARHQLGLDVLGGGTLLGLDVTDGARNLAGWSGMVVDARLHWGLRW